MSSDSSIKSLVVTRATLNTETPIAGVEIVPYIVTRKSDGTSTTDDIPRENAIDGQYLRYKWYRSGRKSRTAVGCMKPAELATFKNMVSNQDDIEEGGPKRGWRWGVGNIITTGNAQV